MANLNNQKNIGTKIVVAPGVYRESVTINCGSTSVPLTIQASVHGRGRHRRFRRVNWLVGSVRTSEHVLPQLDL